MTSSTGVNFLAPRYPALNARGFTFVEIMTTLAILAGGIVMLYKAFFLCLDYQNHLTHRAYASNLLEHKIALAEQMLRDYKTLSFQHDSQDEAVVFNGREFTFHVDIQMIPAPEASSLYQVNVMVAWRENKRDVALKRSAYISSLTTIRNPDS